MKLPAFFAKFLFAFLWLFCNAARPGATIGLEQR